MVGASGYLGKEQVPWLSTEWVLSQFDDRLGIARRRYRALSGQGRSEATGRNFTRGVMIRVFWEMTVSGRRC